MQAPVSVQVRERAERLHHGLVERLRMVGAFQHDVAVGEHRVNVAGGIGGGAHQVARVVAAQIAEHFPVVLGMHQHRVVLRRAEIEHGLEHLVGDLDARKRRCGRLLVLGGDDGHHVADEAHVPIDDQPVVGAGLRIGLPGVAEARARDVFPGVDIDDAGNLLRLGCVDGRNDSVGVRAAQKLHH